MMNSRIFLAGLSTLLCSLSLLAQEKATSTNKMLTVAEVLALNDKPDDRSQMIPEIKAIIVNAKKYRGRVVVLTAEGQSHYPKPFEINEKWVDGKWVVSSSEAADFPGKDKLTVQLMTYDAESKRFIRYTKQPAMDETPTLIIKEIGMQVGDTRSIEWKSGMTPDGLGSNVKETYTDTGVSWKGIYTEKGKYKMTLTGSVKKIR